MPTRGTAAVIAVLAIAAGAESASAQEWRDMTTSRRIDGESQVDVRVRYGAGQLRIGPADRGTLYRMDLTWDEEQFDPVVDFDGRRLELGVETDRGSVNMRGDRNRNEMELGLARGVEMDLQLEFGAVEADVDLGGISIRRLELATGASESRIDVSEANPVRMDRATISVGAADFEARRLGNLNTESIELNAGVGSVMLDLTGDVQRDMEVLVKMGMGSLELVLPRGVGVRIEKDSFLASLDVDDMVKRSGAWYSENWDDAEHRITIDLKTAFGSIDVRWAR